jgi:hypothetical protein
MKVAFMNLALIDEFASCSIYLLLLLLMVMCMYVCNLLL